MTLLGALRQLRSLDLHKCGKLKGTHVVKALREHNPRIERLVLSDWRNNLGNKTLHMLAPLQELAVLDVHGNAGNHEGLTALIEGAAALTVRSHPSSSCIDAPFAD